MGAYSLLFSLFSLLSSFSSRSRPLSCIGSVCLVHAGFEPSPLPCMLLASKRLFSLILSSETQILSPGDRKSVPRRQNFCPLEDRISPRGQNQSVRGTQRGDRNCALEGHEEEVVAEPQGEPPDEVRGPKADVAGVGGQAPQAAEAEVQGEAETGKGRSRP